MLQEARVEQILGCIVSTAMGEKHEVEARPAMSGTQGGVAATATDLALVEIMAAAPRAEPRRGYGQTRRPGEKAEPREEATIRRPLPATSSLQAGELGIDGLSGQGRTRPPHLQLRPFRERLRCRGRTRVVARPHHSRIDGHAVRQHASRDRGIARRDALPAHRIYEQHRPIRLRFSAEQALAVASNPSQAQRPRKRVTASNRSMLSPYVTGGLPR